MNTGLPLLIFGDVVISILSGYLGFFLRYGSLPSSEELSGSSLSVFTFVLIFLSFLLELYNPEKNVDKKKEVLLRASITVIISFFILSSVYYMAPSVRIWRSCLILSLCIFGLCQFMWHIGFELCINFPGIAKRVLVLGTGPLAEKIGDAIISTNHYHVLAGYVNYSEPMHVPSKYVINTNGGGLIETVRNERANKIVVSMSDRRGTFPLKEVLNCKLSGVEVIDAPSFYEQLTGKLLIEDIKPSWFIFSDGFRITSARLFYKRVFDVIFSLFGLIIVLPLLPLIAIIIKLFSPGTVLFKQERVGQGEKNFTLYKFRTMMQDAESKTGAVWSQKNDPRITRAGKILRKTRLDELPQLYNVLKGDMSFVGPRPERRVFVKKLQEVIPYYSERHSIKPGLTGWAQVRFPYGASVEDTIEKLRYDLFYLKRLSIFFDLLIILETIKVVILGKGGR